MDNLKNLIYALACLSFTIIIGAGVYEHLAVWPRAISEPPQSLSIFQGEYALNAQAFWPRIHPVTIILLIVSLLLFWKSERRKNVLIVLIGYIVIMVVTFTYFVPEIFDIITTEYAATADEALIERAKLWENLSILRLLIMIGLAIYLYFGLIKSVSLKR